MSTSWEAIEIQAMTYIKNDLSLDWDRSNRLAVFYNRMADYMNWAMSYFNRPPEIIAKLEDNTPPEFADMDYTPEEPQIAGETGVEIETDMTGYDVCSVGLVGTDPYGNPTYTKIDSIYASDSGVVILNTDIAAGQTLSLNFYKSGQFNQNLSNTEKSILAYAIYVAWEHRFDNNALERTAKIRDASFTTISEASHTNANTSRQKEVLNELYGKLRKYEDDLAYLEVMRR